VQVDGLLTLNSGAGTLTITGGTLNGSGDIHGSVVATSGTVAGELEIGGNLEIGTNGVLSIGNSPGTITVDGNFVMDPGALWNVEIDSLSLYDRLIVGGSATLGGTLNLLLNPAFLPGSDARFTILSASSLSGAFNSVVFPEGIWHLSFEGGNLVLASGTEAPEPASFVLFGAGLLMVAAVARKRRGIGRRN